MYTANPRVNVELHQRLPSPARQQLINPDRSSLSPEHIDWPQAPQHLQHPLTSCSPSPRSVRRSVSPVSPLSSRPPGGVGEMELDLSPSRGPSPLAENCADGPDGSPAFRRHLVSTDDSCHQAAVLGLAEASVRLQPPERNRNMSLLLKELDTLREINKKLCDQLTHKEEELQRREVEEQLREEQREARDWERPSVMLEEVLATQKDRDQALMSRLLLANEERDEALLRVRRLQQAADWFAASTCSVRHSECPGKPAGFLDSWSQYIINSTILNSGQAMAQFPKSGHVRSRTFFVWKWRVCWILLHDSAS